MQELCYNCKDTTSRSLVSYRGIVPERTEDFPFGEMGALVVAPSCGRNCKGCFNQHLKEAALLSDTARNIVDKILQNPLHQWVGLGGLEWSESPAGMLAIAYEAKRRGTKCIIYTGLECGQFRELVGEHAWRKLEGVYLKCGPYREEEKCDQTDEFGHRSSNYRAWFGVPMASRNQFIIVIPGPHGY